MCISKRCLCVCVCSSVCTCGTEKSKNIERYRVDAMQKKKTRAINKIWKRQNYMTIYIHSFYTHTPLTNSFVHNVCSSVPLCIWNRMLESLVCTTFFFFVRFDFYCYSYRAISNIYVYIYISIYTKASEWVIWRDRIHIPFSLHRKVMRAVCQEYWEVEKNG